jgi:hypothetical protein
MASDVGTIGLSEDEVAGLRLYLKKGGFLWVGDHGRIIAMMTHNTDVSNSWERETATRPISISSRSTAMRSGSTFFSTR